MTLGQALHMESERHSSERLLNTPKREAHHRIDALEAEVAALRAELAEVRRMTIGARFAHASDYEHRGE